MRAILAALLFAGAAAPCLAQTATPAPASTPEAATDPDPRNLALAREIIDIAYPEARRAETLTRRIQAMTEQVRVSLAETLGGRVDDGGLQIFNRYLDGMRALTARVSTEHSPALYEAYARSYARSLAYEELVQARAFLRTPAGARFMQQSSGMSGDPDVFRAATAFGTAFAREMEPVQARFDEELRAYAASRDRQRPQ